MFDSSLPEFIPLEEVAAAFKVEPALVARWPDSPQMGFPHWFTLSGQRYFSRSELLLWWRQYGPAQLGAPDAEIPFPAFVEGPRPLDCGQ